jgi:hypothetical protein
MDINVFRFMAMVMVCLLIFLVICSIQFLDIRTQIARIEANGIEACYGLKCDFNMIGKVYCKTTAVEKPKINSFDVEEWFNGSSDIVGAGKGNR